jgi:hypothetical protein
MLIPASSSGGSPGRSSSKINTRLGFSVEKPSASNQRNNDTNNDDDLLIQSSGSYTPIHKGDLSTTTAGGGNRTQRSIYMENQLDLNDAEMAYFEEVVNDLLQKLEHMKEEKDDLQSIANVLGERLQKLGQQKEEALTQAAESFEAQRLQLLGQIRSLEGRLEDATKV